MTPDLQKLRRFSLALGVILFSYMVIGFEPVLDTDGKARIDLPLMAFTVKRHDLIPIALVLGSFWGLVLFWYYGFMGNPSPWRQKKGLLERAERSSAEENYSIEGLSRDEADELEREIKRLFPRFLNRDLRVTRETTKEASTETVVASIDRSTLTIEHPAMFKIAFGITRRQRVGAWFQDFDYSAPIWTNLIALSFWFYSMNLLREFAGSVAIIGFIGIGVYKRSERLPRPTPEERRAVRTPTDFGR